MGFIGKFGMVFVYYFLASLIDMIFMMVFGNAVISFICTVLCLCVISCAFRMAKIKGKNIPQETRGHYKASFKNKFDYILKAKDIYVEIVLGVLTALVFTLIPRIAYGACYVFYSNRYIALILLPIFVIVDFFIWVAAYNRSFRIKKY